MNEKSQSALRKIKKEDKRWKKRRREWLIFSDDLNVFIKYSKLKFLISKSLLGERTEIESYFDPREKRTEYVIFTIFIYFFFILEILIFILDILINFSLKKMVKIWWNFKVSFQWKPSFDVLKVEFVNKNYATKISEIISNEF